MRNDLFAACDCFLALSQQGQNDFLIVSAQYDSGEGGVRINADILAGVAPLNTDMLTVVLS